MTKLINDLSNDPLCLATLATFGMYFFLGGKAIIHLKNKYYVYNNNQYLYWFLHFAIQKQNTKKTVPD